MVCKLSVVSREERLLLPCDRKILFLEIMQIPGSKYVLDQLKLNLYIIISYSKACISSGDNITARFKTSPNLTFDRFRTFQPCFEASNLTGKILANNRSSGRFDYLKNNLIGQIDFKRNHLG